MTEPGASTTTVIGPDASISGEMHFEGNARILGAFEGRISSKGEIHIGEHATCKASIEASRVIIDGLVEGDVVALDRVQLAAHARLIGDLVAGALVVAEGASFEGRCRVGPVADRPASERAARAESKPAPAKASAATVTTRPATPASNGVARTAAVVSPIAAVAAELENDPEFRALTGS